MQEKHRQGEDATEPDIEADSLLSELLLTQRTDDGQEKRGDRQLAFQTAVQLWMYQGEVNWNRYNVMLVANSIIVAVISASFTISTRPFVVAVTLPVLGLLLCVVWMLLTMRGFGYHDYWIYCTRELGERLFPDMENVFGGFYDFGRGKPISFAIRGKKLTRRMGRVSLLIRQRWASYVVILVFAVMYIALIVQR